ncbi:unnamed protein product [Callosobruchus maculatus]|uniref:Uncharacterized protein n=1 Tax=Callosobruchus maculatus TaxID=64391 RepID=A0A653C7T4_CALMS|nr:unnamed protein product [Callosobruchus maculatus]
MELFYKSSIQFLGHFNRTKLRGTYEPCHRKNVVFHATAKTSIAKHGVVYDKSIIS